MTDTRPRSPTWPTSRSSRPGLDAAGQPHDGRGQGHRLRGHEHALGADHGRPRVPPSTLAARPAAGPDAHRTLRGVGRGGLHRGRVRAAAAAVSDADGGAPPRPLPDAVGELLRGRLRGPHRPLHPPARDQRPGRRLPRRASASSTSAAATATSCTPACAAGAASRRWASTTARSRSATRPPRATASAWPPETARLPGRLGLRLRPEPTSRSTSRSRTASSTTSTTRTPRTARCTGCSSPAAGSGSTPTAPARSATTCGTPRCASSAKVPYDAVLEVLDFLGVETNKRYHLGDGLNAVYRHTTYEDVPRPPGGLRVRQPPPAGRGLPDRLRPRRDRGRSVRRREVRVGRHPRARPEAALAPCAASPASSAARRWTRDRVRRTLETMRHRGPDDASHRAFDTPDGRRVELLHTRLTIIDLDPRSQPAVPVRRPVAGLQRRALQLPRGARAAWSETAPGFRTSSRHRGPGRRPRPPRRGRARRSARACGRSRPTTRRRASCCCPATASARSRCTSRATTRGLFFGSRGEVPLRADGPHAGGQPPRTCSATWSTATSRSTSPATRSSRASRSCPRHRAADRAGAATSAASRYWSPPAPEPAST